jgi:MFS superfamily sulfate permease-like transporter
MSYASGLAKLNPVAGIYSVIIPGIVYSLLGTCRYVAIKWYMKTIVLIPLFRPLLPAHSQLSVGPEAALSLLVGQLVTDALEADLHHAPKHPEQVAMAIAGITAMQVSHCPLDI